jgi:uncharacterized RmlC-like cupin family protein
MQLRTRRELMGAADRVGLVRREDRVQADPTPGMSREQAIEVEGLWAGVVRTDPGATSGWHHHGDYETSIYVVSGSLKMECGPGGHHTVTALPGDFVHVPSGAIHRETNGSAEPSELIVVRAGHGVTTVNLDAPAPDEAADAPTERDNS